MRKGPSDSDMALRSRPTVVSDATILPSSITRAILRPSSEPERTSALSRSPADRWTMPYDSTSFSHWVPLPLPGPPMTK